jgi:D-glycero-D-manno-heptose 1,7-bisphosphate phosphatase
MLCTRAVFLDRDGVLNAPSFNSKTSQYEAPHRFKDLKIYPETFSAIKKLQNQFLLFVVSNQPDYALGKTTLEDLKEVAAGFEADALKSGVKIEKFYYCHHHPKGVIPEFTLDCLCRKPKAYFLRDAAKVFNVELRNSWMVGDRDTDIECGKSVGCKTILVDNPLAKEKQGSQMPTAKALNISEAVEIILKGEY